MEHSNAGRDINNALEMWVVYDSPIDYPQKFVARRFDIGKGVIRAMENVLVADTLEDVRDMLPYGLVRMDRSRGDPAHIVESWI